MSEIYNVNWKYPIGKEVWYVYYDKIKKGKIERHVPRINSYNDVSPAYKIRWGNKDYEYDNIEEDKIIKDNCKHLDKLEKLYKLQEKQKADRIKTDEEVNDLAYRIEHNWMH